MNALTAGCPAISMGKRVARLLALIDTAKPGAAVFVDD
jgi:hypothetical protein